MNYAALLPQQPGALDWLKRGLNPALLSGAMTVSGASTQDFSAGETLADGTKAAIPNWGAMLPGAVGEAPFGQMGADMRDALARNAMQERPKPKILGMDRDTFAKILGVVGDAITGANGGQPIFAPAYMRQRELQQQQEFDRERWAAELEAKRQSALAPRIEQVGNTLGWVDPSASSFSPIFTAPEEFEIFARQSGFEPGTPEYIDAIREYRAGTWGPQGVQGRLTVQQPRLDVSERNNIRSTSTSRENSIRSTGQSDTNSRRSAETTRGSYSYSHGGRSDGRSGDLVGPVYQKSGKRIRYSKKAGGYVDLATGQRVQ